SQTKTPLRGSPRAVKVYVPQRASEASERDRKAAAGGARRGDAEAKRRPPSGGHHGRSKSTCPKERAKRASATEKRPRANTEKLSPKPNEDPPPGVTTGGQSLRAPKSERSERARPKSGRGRTPKSCRRSQTKTAHR